MEFLFENFLKIDPEPTMRVELSRFAQTYLECKSFNSVGAFEIPTISNGTFINLVGLVMQISKASVVLRFSNNLVSELPKHNYSWQLGGFVLVRGVKYREAPQNFESLSLIRRADLIQNLRVQVELQITN